MHKDDYIAALERESAAFITAVMSDLDAAVPTCGDWTNRDLAAHQGKVWAIATANVAAASASPTPPGDRGTMPDDDAQIETWLNERRAAVVTTLGASEPEQDSWTFTPVHATAGFWQRRMANETLIHRWDAENAAGTADALDADMARDGIDEYFEVGLRYSSSKPNRQYPTETLHLHRTDGDGEWMLVGDGENVTVTEEHAKGDAAVRGSASDLLLWVWNRPNGAEILGDADVAAAWQAVAP